MSSYIDIIRSNEAAAQKKHEWRSETFSKEITCCYCGSPLKKKSKGRWTGHKCANCRAVAHKECCVFVEKHCPLPDVFGGGSSNRVNGPKSAQTLRAKTLKNTMCVSNTAEPVFLPTNGPSDPTKVPSLNPSFGQGQGKSKGKGAQAPSAPAPVPVPVPPVTVPTAMPPVVTPIKTKKSSKRTKNIKTNGGGGGNSGDAVVNSSTASTVVTNNMSTTATGITVREPPNTVSPFKTKRIPSSSSSNNNDNNGSSSSGGGGSSSSRSSCSNSNNSDGSNVNVNVSTNISGKDTSRSRSRSISSSAHGLPANWNMRFDKKTHKYYYSDKEKRRTVWIPPQDVLDEVALPPKWRVDIEEETNRMVYVDTVTGVRQYTYPDMTILASSPQPALEVSFVLTRPTITFKALQSMTFYVPKQPTQPAPSLSSLPSQPWLMPQQQQQQQTPMQYQLPSFVRQQITSPVMFSATHTETNFERRVPVYPYSPQMELPIQQQQQQMQVQVQMQMQMQPSPSSLAGLEIPLSGLTSRSKSASASSSSSPSPSPSRMELHKSRNGFVPPPPPPQFLETKERPIPVAAHTSMPTLGSSSPSHPFLPSSSLTVSINPLPHSYQPNDAQHMEKPFVETEGMLPDCPHPEQPMTPVHTVYTGRCGFVPPPFPLSSSLPHQQQQQQSQLEAVSPTIQQTENAVPASVPASDEPVTADTPEIKISIYPKVSSNTSTDSVHSDESDSDSDGKSERNPRSESESNADDDRVEEEDEEEEKEEREKREKEEEEEDTPQKQESNTSKSSSPKVVVATSSSITTNPSGSHSNSRSQSPRATPPHLENDHSESSLSSSSSSSSTCSSSATTISSTGGISEEWPHVEVDIFGKDTDTQVFTDFENNSKNSSVTE